MNENTIKIDLSLFFDDERKMVCIFLDPNWETVECLQRRVELLFDISSVSFLSDGCYLPSKESIKIIKHCHIIKAFVLKASHDVRKKKKSKKFKETLETSTSEEALTKENKTKNGSDELVTSTYGYKVTSPISITNVLLEEELSSNKSQGHPSKKRKTGMSNFPEENNNAQQSDNSESPINPSKKQKPVNNEIMSTTRISQLASSTLLDQHDLLGECNNTPQLSNSKNMNNPFKKCKSNKAHIYFDETGDILGSKSENKSLTNIDKKSGTMVVFRCPLNENSDGDQPQKPRIFHLKSKNTTARPIIEIQENILLPPHPTQSPTTKSFSSNETTIIDNGENDITEKYAFNNHQNSINSTIPQTEDINNDSQNGETNINEIEKESMSNKDINDSSNMLTKFSYVDEPVSKTQNEIPKLNTSIAGNNSNMETEPSYAEGQDSVVEDNQVDENGSSIMSVDYVDLSIDLENEVSLKDGIKEQHYSTSDDDCNKASNAEEVSEVIDLNESDYNCNSVLNSSKPQFTSLEKIRVRTILPVSKDLTVLPSTDDIIIFKVKYTNNKTHASTNFIAGKVEYVNKRTKNIKVLILDGISELCHVPSKFMCNLDDSIQSANKHLQLKFTDMVEPKLFSMS